MVVSSQPSPMDSVPFHDGNISRLIDRRFVDFRHSAFPFLSRGDFAFQDAAHSLQSHSSLMQRLSLERELEGHLGCVNTIAWNSQGSLLISGSDDQRINIWNYCTRKLLHSIETGHATNIFCTKFVPETSDELVGSGAGDCEVRVFNVSRLSQTQADASAVTPHAHFQCHTKRVKKLAVEVGNPNVVWSASEDGTLRQHDFREVCSCPPNGPSDPECRSVLLDLRSGEKRSLSDPPNGTLNLKSCDISLTRPHLLLVGGSDAFARLYDRRMLPPLSSSQRRLSPPPCVNYFCPMHLSERAGRSLHLTHVAFSPNGEEVVISYSGEHVYLFDVNQGASSVVKYASGDVAKQWSLSPILSGAQLQASRKFAEASSRSKTSDQLDGCRKLLQTAEKCLNEGSNYYCGIEVCNEVLEGRDCKIDLILEHNCLCIRAALLLKRKWKNDAHMALRDLNQALRIDPSSYRALYCMSEALVELGKHKEALDFALAAQLLVPSSEVAQRIEDIKKRLASDSDVTQGGPRSERGYSDVLELDFETSISGDEESDDDSNYRSFNLKIHRKADSPKEAGSSDHSCASSTMQNEKATYKPEAAIDMKRRFVGHCNMGTDIKQASFLGQRGDYIASGSDDGRWFIWEKKTGRLIKMLLGDQAVVNCIQCHPFDSVIATSGIDNTIKIWTPTAPLQSRVAGGSAGPDTSDVIEVMEANQRSLSRLLGPLVPFEILERLGMPDSFGGSLEGVQCTQS